MEDNLNEKRQWRSGEDRRKYQRRFKDGTPQERQDTAEVLKLGRRMEKIKSPGELPRQTVFFKSIAFWMLIIILAISFFAVFSHADEPLINMNKIMMIESGGNPLAHEKWGGVGLFQISKPVLADFNKQLDCGLDCSMIPRLTMNDMFNAKHNRFVADWYINYRIPQLLRHYHKKVTVRNVLICYNAGIIYVAQNRKLPKTTLNYLRKYGVK